MKSFQKPRTNRVTGCENFGKFLRNSQKHIFEGFYGFVTMKIRVTALHGVKGLAR